MIGYAAGEHGLHHQESVGDLCSAQDEHTGTLRSLHHLGHRAELLFKEAAHSGGQYLFKAAETGLIPVGSGKCVADIAVGQRGQLFHQQGAGLLLVGQAELCLKEGLLLCHETDIVQKQDLPVLQCTDRLPGGGTAHIVDPFHLAAQQL